jgi:pilus assembly protein CpaF
MFPNLETKSTTQISWEQRLLKNGGKSKGALKPEYQELKFTLHRKLVDKINLEALATIDNQRVRSEVRQALISLIDSEPTLLSSLEKQQICDEVLDEVFGLGPLEPLLQDPSISDILVNTYKQVYVERKGLLELTTSPSATTSTCCASSTKSFRQVGRRVDESTPMVDARLSDGSRVNAIIPPLAVDGPLLSIRRFSTDKLMPADLVDRRAMTPGMMELLEAAVKAKMNIIIAGGTGAGKTTLLNALSAFISPKERIVTIEDAAELQLKQPHVARLETRPPNLEGHGAVRQRELLVNSLRMRPDRIVVGEVRGEEALDMLQAMNTGHDGSLTTVHANSPRDAISRLEVMVSLANANMQLTSIRQQIASAVHLLVQASRMSDGSRRVVNLTEVTGMEGEVVTLQDIFVFEKRGLNPDGKVVGRFAATGIRPKFYEKLLSAGIRLRRTCSTRWWRFDAMFVLIAIAVWACALVIWWICSNAFRHSDLDKLKSRLIGTRQSKAGKVPAATGGSLIQADERTSAGHQVPAALPAAEQVAGDARAGRDEVEHAPAGEHLPGGGGGGLGAGWVLLPDQFRRFSYLPALAAGALPVLYVMRKRKARCAASRSCFPTAWSSCRAPCAPATPSRCRSK